MSEYRRRRACYFDARLHFEELVHFLTSILYRIYECMRMEGAVASQLSPHPLLVDIYGFCALSMFNEAMMEGDAERPAGP